MLLVSVSTFPQTLPTSDPIFFPRCDFFAPLSLSVVCRREEEDGDESPEDVERVVVFMDDDATDDDGFGERMGPRPIARSAWDLNVPRDGRLRVCVRGGEGEESGRLLERDRWIVSASSRSTSP